MGRNYKNASTTETIAIGIRGDRHSLCGAIKRFELHEKRGNSLLSLKEQCARRIALIKNEHIKWFITSYLSEDLFKFVTKDIFNLRGEEFTSKYAKPLYMCQECTMDSYEDPSDDCGCPKMEAAIDAMNNYLFKRTNNKKNQTNNLKRFELIYKIPNDVDDHSYDLKRETPFFLYLAPAQHKDNIYHDENYGVFQKHHLLHSHISAKDKLLFVDAMRFFGGFRTNQEKPQLIFYRRRELVL